MRKVQVGMDPLNMLLKKNKKKKVPEVKKEEQIKCQKKMKKNLK